MGLFCLLWVPLSYFLRRLLAVGSRGGGIWALIFGSAVVIAQFFVGPLVEPGCFGFDRWLSGFVDIVSVPVLAPLILYLLFVEMNLLSPKTDYAGFVLLWLIPLSAFRATAWLSPASLVMLVVVPLLWVSLAVGIPALFAYARKRGSWYGMAPALLCMAVLPFSAATSWWAFFIHETLLGFLLLAISAAPALASTALSIARLVAARDRATPASAIEAMEEAETEDAEPEDEFPQEEFPRDEESFEDTP